MSRRALGLVGLTAGVLSLVGSTVLGVYRRDLRRSFERVRQGGRIAQTSRGPVDYAVAGSGPAALLVHGAGGGYDQGLFLAQSFPQCQAIAPSRFGYLETPMPHDASPAAQADAHAALLDSLGIETAVVAGASAGAPSAVELALRHPQRVRALILLVPMGYTPDRMPGVPSTPTNNAILRIVLSGANFAYWSALRGTRSTLVRFMGVPPELEAHAPAAERARVMTIMESVLPLSTRVAGIRNDSAITLQPLPLDLIRVPTLIITTRDDLFDTLPAAEFMAKGIAGAKLIVLDSGGHLFVGRQNEVNGAIANFLADIGSADSETHPFEDRARSA